MSDDKELVRQARTCPYGTKQTDASLVEMADRIEALIAERDAARDAALEEAAKLAESMADTEANMNNVWMNGCRDAAESIRAMKGPTP